jgi:diguanylate cyclase (GGDEF)-like protein
MNNKQVKWYKSLIVKVNWAIIFIIIIFIALLSLSFNNLFSEELSSQVKEVNLEIARALKNNVDNLLDNTEDVIYLTSSFITERLDDPAQISDLLESVKNEYSQLKYLYYADSSGQITITPDIDLKEDYNPRRRSWYQKALEAEDLIWTDSYLDANQEFLMITAALPIKNKAGKIVGVLAGDILLDQLSNTIANKKIGKTGYAYIVNQRGEVIAHPDYSLIKTKANIKEMVDYKQMQNSKSGTLSYQDAGEEKLAAFVALERLNSKIFVQIKSQEAFSVKKKLETIVLKISLVIISILVFTVFVINKKYLLDPLHQLMDNVIEVANGNYDANISKPRDDEIGKLSESFNYMTDEISAAYQQLEAYNQEITDLSQDLKYQAYHDPLTGLANRRKFMEKLDELVASKTKAAVILLDFDNFKEINDTVGHIYGDHLLKEFSQLLLNSFGDNVFVARYGGDEFLLLIKDINTTADVKRYIECLEAIVAEPFLINEGEFYLDFSLGISCHPKDSTTSYELITMADTAMYQAKGLHNQNYLFYTAEIYNKIKDKKYIREILRNAIKDDAFQLNYQPQVDLKSGKVESFEALLRLRDYNISPAKFIPVAEDSGQIIEIGRWVTARAIEDLAILQQETNHDLKISINFSVQQLNDNGYLDFLAAKLSQNQIKAESLEIEITESLLIREQEKALAYLEDLTKLGIKLALDDFGTGYSSLSYLTYISFAKVKLDKVLIDKFLEHDSLKTIDSLISLFHNLNLPVVAEGVETKAQLTKLDAVDCDYIQGYLFSKPVLFTELKALLEQKFI